MTCAFALSLGCFVCVKGMAEDSSKATESKEENFNYQTTTKKGLVFRVPEDMPIEERNGIVQPIPFDEYMYGKFKKLEDRLEKIELQIGAVETRIENIEKQPVLPTDSESNDSKILV